MGGSLAVHNRTTVTVQLTICNQRVQLKRTCSPNTICTFTNIQPKKYEVEVAVNNKTVLFTTCRATGQLWNLTETSQHEFQLRCDCNTAFVSIRRRGWGGRKSLLPEFKGKTVSLSDLKVLRGRSTYQTGVQVGWNLSQIGAVNVDHLELDDSNPDSIKNVIEDAIAKCEKEVVLVFTEPVTKQQSNSEYRPEELETAPSLQPVLVVDIKHIAGENLPTLEKDSYIDILDIVSLESEIFQNAVKTDEPKPMFSSLRSFLSKKTVFGWMRKSRISHRKPLIKIKYETIKEWLFLNDAHRSQVECDRMLSRNLVVKLIKLFEKEQEVMQKKQIHIGPNHERGLTSSDESSTDTWNVRKSLLQATDFAEFLESRTDSEANSGVLEPALLAQSKSWPAKVNLYHNEEGSKSAGDQDCMDLTLKSAAPLSQLNVTPEVSVLKECSIDSVANRISTINDRRRFGYPFLQSVDRLSNLGLELNEMDPLKFLEHEVHYVQASLEAQEAITGEPFDIDYEECIAPRWTVFYVDGTSKFFWKHEDGSIALDPPFQEFWVLLADPSKPLNPFPYPC